MVESHYKILDDIINTLYNNQIVLNGGGMASHEIDRDVVNNEDDEKIFNLALKKLTKEKYITISDRIVQTLGGTFETVRDYYELTFEGTLLKEDGNYSQMIQRNLKKIEESDRIQGNLDRYNRAIKNLTIVIAFGTIVACLYTLLQVYDWLHSHHYFYYNFCKKVWIHF